MHILIHIMIWVNVKYKTIFNTRQHMQLKLYKDKISTYTLVFLSTFVHDCII